MNKQTWLIAGGLAVVAVVVALFMRNKNAAQDTSQLPAAEEQANYSVPPSIGVTENPPTQVMQPQGSTLTTSQAQALPTTNSMTTY